jgi:hypothetical protein
MLAVEFPGKVVSPQATPSGDSRDTMLKSAAESLC